ncbi:hypothetical protein COCON_G00223640 [Conger conger]|uniref:Serglycin n=1 Tax=Conger conger TaxID=82655 RepID=A0A9Q1HMU1_CONCO|nr:serglycin [Conger conger]KAJ8250442.1 hypothetical protein COCON_G00223640 [Conger conger]
MGHLLKILIAFLVFNLLGQDAEGAPAKGRYVWVRCRPDDRHANCLKEWGPWMNLPGPRDRLPPSAVQDIMKGSLDLDLQSADGSGASGLFMEFGSGEQTSTDWGSGEQSSTDGGSGEQWPLAWQDLGFLTAEGRVQQLEGSGSQGNIFEGSASEGSGSVLDYTDYDAAQRMTVQQNNVPHTLELQEDNLSL